PCFESLVQEARRNSQTNNATLSKKAKLRIAAKYHDSIAISEIARDLGVSHAHLTRQFRPTSQSRPLAIGTNCVFMRPSRGFIRDGRLWMPPTSPDSMMSADFMKASGR